MKFGKAQAAASTELSRNSWGMAKILAEIPTPSLATDLDDTLAALTG
ncbi:hypothetical protein ACIPJS_13740 [Streptomyces sp. NPDC086783]